MAEGWGWFIGKIVAKTGAKMALNVYTCGLGAIVEFADALIDFSNGDMVGGCISIVSGFGDLATAGMFSNMKEAMTQSSKKAVVETAKTGAKEFSKESTKKFGKEFSKELAKGMVTPAEKEFKIKCARETAHLIRKYANKKFGQKVGEELAKGLISETVEEVLSGSGKTLMAQKMFFEVAAYGGKQYEKALVEGLISEGLPQFYLEIFKSNKKEAAFTFKEAARTAAQTEFNKHTRKLLAKDCGFALAKLGINTTEISPADSRESQYCLSTCDCIHSIEKRLSGLKS